MTRTSHISQATRSQQLPAKQSAQTNTPTTSPHTPPRVLKSNAQPPQSGSVPALPVGTLSSSDFQSFFGAFQ